MNDSKILPDDPKLTAYALGELEGEERAAVEAALELNPALRMTVDEIRALGAQLETALAAEPVEAAPVADAAPSLARAAIIPGRDPGKLDGGDYRSPRDGSPWKIARLPQAYFVIAGLAAACFAMFVALRTPPPRRPAPAPAQKIYTQIDLTTLPRAVDLPVAPAAEPETQAKADAAPTAAPAAPPPTSRLEMPAGPSQADEKFSLLGQVKNEMGAMRIAAPLAASVQPKVGMVAGEDRARGTPAPATITGASGFAAAEVKSAVAAALPAGDVPPPTPPQAKDDQVVQLSAFSVASSNDARYTIDGTLPGSRIHVNGANAPAPKAAGRAAARQVAMSARNGDRGPQPPLLPAAPGGPDIMPATPGPAPGGSEVMPWVSAPAPAPANTETYADFADNAFLGAAQNRLSTFAIDVDTAGYSNVRRFLAAGRLPPRDAVRIEELVNYFPYRYPAPVTPPPGAVSERTDGPVAPFAASLEVADAPWAPTHRLVRIGLKGREVAADARPAANLVFLLDVSGSMGEPNKLPLVKESMRLLVGKLRPDDRVAIVTYAGQSGLALPSTPVAKSRDILAALDALTPGGSTNGGMGLQLAYDIAKANLVAGGINRVILCTDGDFNVGVTGEGELERLVAEKAKSGVALTALGFGMGNLKDRTLEKIADRGNGNYGYIDTRREAEKLLVEQVDGTLMAIAKDVKVQVEFNPAKVASYRLIGYENRTLKKEDFNDDRVDGGEIGAGHTVTALYEIVPVGVAENPAATVPAVDELKYGKADGVASAGSPAAGELLTVKLRYKEPAGDVSRKLDFPLTDAGGRFENASADFKFAAAVAAFGMILRESPHKGTATMGDVIAWAAAGAARAGSDAGGYRGEFIDLARKAQTLLR